MSRCELHKKDAKKAQGQTTRHDPLVNDFDKNSSDSIIHLCDAILIFVKDIIQLDRLYPGTVAMGQFVVEYPPCSWHGRSFEPHGGVECGRRKC
jgi:hypothetical protein